MRKSKFVGNVYNGWLCTKIMIATSRGNGSNHYSYKYRLQRPTSDGKCIKVMTVSEKTMRKISRGYDPNLSADYKKKYKHLEYDVLYKFI